MTIFRCSLLALCGLWVSGVAAEEMAVTLKSGLAATLTETLWEPQTSPAELWVRFRFVVPGLAGAEPDFDVMGADLEALCRDVVLPAIAKAGKAADQAVISLSSQAIPFGETNPDVTQVFEAYRVTDGNCILEGF
jgi:Family of unknown function (DUF6497)